MKVSNLVSSALQAAAITCRIAFGPRDGHKALTLRDAMPRESAARQPQCADIDGFSLHAAARVEAHDRKRLEPWCRDITRPALSDERVRLNDAGKVELNLTTPWRNGTAHLAISPLEFMQRLAALVPQAPEVQEQATEATVADPCEVEMVQARPHRFSWARLLKRVFAIDMQHGPNCGARALKIIAAILERPVIESRRPGAGRASRGKTEAA